MTPTMVFIHGLNTYGDGLVHLGPFVFGGMKDHWEKSMRERGFDFFSVRGIGFGPLDEQVDRAHLWLKNEGVLDGKRELVFLGHSLGGLIARGLVAKPDVKRRTKAIVTFGTPHGGAHVTDVALTLDQKAPFMHGFLKKVGYDVEARRETFMNFTLDKVAEFTARHPIPDGIRCVSLLCEVRGREIGWPLVAIHSRLKAIESDPIGDGFILSSSQKWCETQGPFAIDHFGSMGFFFHASLANRARAKREFERLTAAAAKVALDVTL